MNIRACLNSIDSIDMKELFHDAYMIRKDGTLFAKSEFCGPDAIRKCLIYNIIASTSKGSTELYDKISALPEHIAFTYYGKLLRIVEISE